MLGRVFNVAKRPERPLGGRGQASTTVVILCDTASVGHGRQVVAKPILDVENKP